jgi:histidinol-phosphate aminotransferase
MTSKTVSLAERMARTLRSDVAGMHAYAVQDARGLHKLDAMENPHRLPAAMQQQLGQRLVHLRSTAIPMAVSMTCAVR